MQIDVTFPKTTGRVMINHADNSRAISTVVWYDEKQLAELCQQLFKFKNARCKIEADRVVILPAAAADKEAREQVADLAVTLCKDLAEILRRNQAPTYLVSLALNKVTRLFAELTGECL